MLGVMMRSVAKRMAVATLASIMIAVFSLVTPRGPLAAADGGPGAVSADGDSGSAAGGGGSISVNVTVTYSTPGSGGGEVAATSSSQEVSATVKPSCGYRPYRSGKNAAEFLDNGKKTSPNHHKKAWNMIEDGTSTTSRARMTPRATGGSVIVTRMPSLTRSPTTRPGTNSTRAIRNACGYLPVSPARPRMCPARFWPRRRGRR